MSITPTTDELKILQFKASFLDFLNRDSKGEKQFTDGKIQVEGKVFHVHKSLLCSRSDYFNNLYRVEENKDTVKLEMSIERAEKILQYCYTGIIYITKPNVLDLLKDANFLQIADLKKLCEGFLLQKKNIEAENCLKLLVFAQQYNFEKVVDKCKQVIGENFDVISKQDDFNQLSFNDVHAIVQQENIKKQSELVFGAIVKWVNSKPNDRKDLFGKLFLQIDLSSLSQSFLKKTVANEELVRENLPSCKAVLDVLLKSDKKVSSFLVIGGTKNGKQCVLFDVAKNISLSLPNLTTERHEPTSVVFDDKVFVFGGSKDTSCEMFDLQRSSDWVPIAKMPEPRSIAASAVLNDLIYIAGGYDGVQSLSSCFCYDPNRDVWSKITDMSVKRSGHAMVSLNGSLHCIGGFDGNSDLNSCEQFKNRRWMKIPSMNERRSELAAVVLNGCIYAIGGSHEVNSLSLVECYDPRQNKWVLVKPMNVPRSSYGACVLQGKIYAVGGEDNIDSIEVYDPDKNEWTFLCKAKVKACESSVVAIK